MFDRLTRACAILALAAAAPSVAPSATAAQEYPQTMLVLDASGSMWGQIDGRPKIDIARGAIGDLLADLPGTSELGLMAYGHRTKGDCRDIEQLIPAGSLDRAAFAARLDAITPQGKTPLADSVLAAAEALDYADRPARVILISDGRETCAEDPCAAVRALDARGVDFKAHVIGFDVDDAATADLRCIADATGGSYRSAGNAAGLADALTQVAQADTTQALPDSATPEVVGSAIVDEFDRAELGETWEVINPDPRAYILDGGALVALATVPTNIGQDDLTNGFRWTGQPLPDGDWDMSLRFTAPQFTTRRSDLELALYEDADNYVLAGFFGDGSSNDRLQLQVKSMVGGDLDRSRITFADDACCPRDYDIDWVIDQLAEKGGTLTLKRRGREYTAEITARGWTPRDGQDNPLTTDALTVLRASGDPVIYAGTWGRDSGDLPQTTVEIDRFEVTAR